jgi:L-seryl-tRNA(Ser) seleniumtransferase
VPAGSEVGLDDTTRQLLRQLPSVDEILRHEAAMPLLELFSRERVVAAVRDAVSIAREQIAASSIDRVPEPEVLLSRAGELLRASARPHLRRVMNASGVVVHTNLGRAPLAATAIERVIEVSRGYSNLEYRLDRGERGSRHDHVETLLTRLTGAEAAMVVNNNAAAVLLLLSALAGGRDVIVSRGQLVEIGGGFRIPDIMRLSGARLIEVGTTNKTRLEDYAAAIGPDTALLLRVHTSNFKMVGFTEEVGIEALAGLAQEHRLLAADDLGSGALAPLPQFRDEPSVSASLAAGADAVCFSGDKLLGGPQAGILLGRASVMEELKRHPLARAVRVDKMTIAGLEGTLLLYQDPDAARAAVPVLRFLGRPAEETLGVAEALANSIRELVPEGVEIRIEESVGRTGGGALPTLELPSNAVVVDPKAAGVSVTALEEGLRRAPLPVVGRVSQDALYLDALTLELGDVRLVAECLAWAFAWAGGTRDR